MKPKTSNICAIIPARYGSTRLPGKPLLDFHGKPMIQWVCEAASKVYKQVAVATDHKVIMDTVHGYGGTCVMTSQEHLNGTSRVHEAYHSLGWSCDYIVNIQGDEPMIRPQCLIELNQSLSSGTSDIGTLVTTVEDEKELFGESEVFVVRDVTNHAMYFSRSIIPCFHGIPQDQWLEHGKFLKHLGLYAYKPEVLNQLINLKPSFLEISECLEQNRWLEHGFSIMTADTEVDSYPVDTPADVDFVRDMMEKILKK
jgi:3-deoxy-manno-octulosonate cytidylyltransferase (CMP-KDO synthetase)